MKRIRQKLIEFYKEHTPSVKLPLIVVILLFCMVPLIFQGRILARSSRQAQIERRIIDVQNQCQILSDRMSRSGYMTNSRVDNASTDMELSALADIYYGRILIVNPGFKILKDTFSLSEGKICISEEIIRCFQGESTSTYNTEKQYFLLAIPIPENVSQTGEESGRPAGVMVVTASTESILAIEETLIDRTSLYLLLSFAVLLILVLVVVNILLRPFGTIVSSIDQVAAGNMAADINEETYRETKGISRALNRTLTRLRAVDESRQEFVSNVSHELKTPITSIRVLADSLMGMEDAPKELYEEFMHDISDEIDRENQIIDDLLTMVRMDKSSQEISFAPQNINDLVESVLKRLRPIARLRNIELIFESMRDVTADIDEVKFSLAVNNLVENAVKYNREDGWVRVSLDADHKEFTLKVADSGIGIPEELQDRVFERFYRVDKARSRETGGSGLGLSITRQVILMHRGTVTVDSTEGEGTTFTVVIPLNHIS